MASFIFIGIYTPQIQPLAGLTQMKVKAPSAESRADIGATKR